LYKQTSRILHDVNFWGLLCIVVLTAIPFGTVDPIPESLFEASVFVLTILWLIDGILTGLFWVRENRLLLPLFALVCFAFLQSITLWRTVGGSILAGVYLNRSLSLDPFETWRFGLKLLAMTLAMGLLFRYTSSAVRLQILVYVVIGVALASALFGILRSEIPPRVFGSAWFRLNTESSYGQFENRNHFAFLMEMAIGLLLGLTILNRRNGVRFLILLCLGSIVWVALLLTHSRGGLLGLTLEASFFFFIRYRFAMQPDGRRPRTRARRLSTIAVTTSIIVVAVFASIFWIGGDVTISRIESTPTEFSADTTGRPRVLRPQIWIATTKLVKSSPVFGVGFAAYSIAISQYLNSSGDWTPQQAHNDYLELAASGGVVGVLICVWFFVIFLKLALERLRNISQFHRAMRYGALAGLFAVAVHSFFDFGLHITVNGLICILLVVIATKTVSNVGHSALSTS